MIKPTAATASDALRPMLNLIVASPPTMIMKRPRKKSGYFSSLGIRCLSGLFIASGILYDFTLFPKN